MTDFSGTLAHKLAELRARLSELSDLAVAFSGGVDSTVLLAEAIRALGARAVGITADSASLPRAELADARRLAGELGARHEVLATDELLRDAYRVNDGLRCYHCRRTLFEAMLIWATRHGLRNLAFGEIADDRLELRPGSRAARELSVHAPLAEAGWTKCDVREHARALGLSVADKPAAACLASRIPVGTEVTRSRLARVEAAEALVRQRGFSILRVRAHGPLARIEVGPAELEQARALAPNLCADLEPLEFEAVEIEAYVAPLER